MIHLIHLLAVLIALLALPVAAATPAPSSPASSPAPIVTVQANSFAAWVERFRPRALREGISPETFAQAFRGAQFLPDSIERDRNQAEFSRPLADYLATAASDNRVSNGRALLRQYAGLLDRIEAQFGVDRHVVVAIWGMESNYGQRRGDVPLISTLATLAFEGRRGAFFEQQLIAALQILQRGDITPERMTGSWAGAMGHTQFIPTSYAAYAVDFTGDGRRDIWSDDPSDALASTAAYLQRFGWTRGQPALVEVRVPRGFNFAAADRSVARSPAAWAQLGVTDPQGRAVPNYGNARLFLPTGAGGPAFLIFRNFDVIARYNNADAYILGVAILGERVRGMGPLSQPFPPGERDLTRAERVELQQRLNALGLGTGGVDGRIGPATRAAIRAVQARVGLPQDGHASLSLLQRLR